MESDARAEALTETERAFDAWYESLLLDGRQLAVHRADPDSFVAGAEWRESRVKELEAALQEQADTIRSYHRFIARTSAFRNSVSVALTAFDRDEANPRPAESPQGGDDGGS